MMAASSASGTRVPGPASTARAAPSERGMPRKPIAKTLAKQVTASPAVRASKRAGDREHDLDRGRGQERRAQYGLQASAIR